MATQTLATVTDVVTRAKEFASLATGAPPVSAEISLAIADAVLQVNVNVWGARAELAQTYLAAHFLTCRNPQLATPAGPSTSDKVGDVETAYAVASGPVTEADYSSSRWGRAYLTLQRQLVACRMTVT